MRPAAWVETCWRDLVYSARGLVKSKGFTTVVVLSLALGIGANSTIFSVMNAVMYRPLPYPRADRLMMIWETKQGDRTQPPVAEIVDWNRQNHVFEDIASTSFTESAPLGGAGKPEQIRVQYCSPNFFGVLGVKPLSGRVFVSSEARDLTQTVVISEGFWKRRFDGDRHVFGKTVSISGVLSTIVGVMPADFAPFYGGRIDVWLPIDPAGDRYSKRDDRGWLYAIGRLRPGVTREQAQAEMNVIAARLQRTYPTTNEGIEASVQPLHDALFSWSGQALYPLAGAVVFVLLIACANVANLLLSRTESRRKEYAVRASLGAARRRLMQQVLIESGLLAAMGGSLGIFLTFGGIALFRTLGGDLPNIGSVVVDKSVLLFTLGASILTALLFGILPAFLASRPNLNMTLREGEGRTMTGGRGVLRQALAVAEVACAMVLLVGAGLMIHSVLHLQQVDPGFESNNVMTAEISLPEGGKYVERVPGGSMEKTSPLATSFYRQLLDRVAALPGVESSAIISFVLGSEYRNFVILDGRASRSDNMPGASYDEVSPSLFRTLRIPLKKGRYLDAHDVQGSPWVAVINESFARSFFPREDPIGKRLRMRYRGYGVDEPEAREIVGVVGDVKHDGLARTAPEAIYASYLQQPAAFPGGCVMAHLHQSLLVKMSSHLSGREAELGSAIQSIVMKLDADQPITEVMSMDRLLATSIDDSKFYMRLLGIFSAIAVLLAATGIYGVMAYFVRERTREMGIRMALGAEAGDLIGMVAQLGLKLTGAGIAIGVLLALVLTRLAASLFAVNAADPFTFGIVGLVLVGVALMACYVPARRATKVDPMVTLRYE